MTAIKAWLAWTLPRAIITSVTLVILGVNHWAAFATAGAMTETLRRTTLFKKETPS